MVGHMHTVRCLQVNYSLVQLFIPTPHYLILRHEGETGQTMSSPSFTYSVMCDVKKKTKKLMAVRTSGHTTPVKGEASI